MNINNSNKKIINRITDIQSNKIISDYKKSVLQNGIRIISEEIPYVESFALGITVNAGSRNDPEGKSGLAHFIEHTAFRRTKTRTSKKIASEFESLGAYTNAFTTKEHTCFYVRALKKHLAKTFEILSDLLINPVFQEKDVEKERDIIIEEIKSYEDDPEELIFDIGDGYCFKNNGLGLPITGNIESVENIKNTDLIEFHSDYFYPQNIIISSAGNISHRELEKMTVKYFGNINKPNLTNTIIKPEIIPVQNVELIKSFQQGHILFCRQTTDVQSEYRYPLLLLNVILGDGMSSRLNQRLRERHGLAYNIYSSFQFFTDCGSAYIYAGTDKGKIKKTKDIITEELLKLIESKILPAEISRAKEQMKASTIMALESMSVRMQSISKNEFLLGYNEDSNMVLQAIESVDNEQIKKAAEYYLAPNNWNIIILKPE